jgi:hypothetical protein
MRIPAFITEHPIESLLAGVLLLAVLFGSADRQAAEAAKPAAQVAAAEKI